MINQDVEEKGEKWSPVNTGKAIKVTEQEKNIFLKIVLREISDKKKQETLPVAW